MSENYPEKFWERFLKNLLLLYCFLILCYKFSVIRHRTGVSKTFTNKGFGFAQNGYIFILFERKFILRFINTKSTVSGKIEGKHFQAV